MSEENQNNNEEIVTQLDVETAATPEASSVEPVAGESAERAATRENVAVEPTPTEPQIIIQRERGFAHYVGFALLSVICICFFFAPGIAITFGVSRGVELNPAAAWIFSAILSFVLWLVFKMKIKGFKKSFYAYIALCVVVTAGLIAAEVLTENYNVFANIFTLLIGAN